MVCLGEQSGSTFPWVVPRLVIQMKKKMHLHTLFGRKMFISLLSAKKKSPADISNIAITENFGLILWILREDTSSHNQIPCSLSSCWVIHNSCELPWFWVWYNMYNSKQESNSTSNYSQMHRIRANFDLGQLDITGQSTRTESFVSLLC